MKRFSRPFYTIICIVRSIPNINFTYQIKSQLIRMLGNHRLSVYYRQV